MLNRKVIGLFAVAGVLSACGGEVGSDQANTPLTSAQDGDTLHEWLIQEEAASLDVMRIHVTPEEIEAVHANTEPRLKVGVVKDLDVTIDFSGTATAGLRTSETGFVWSGVVESAGAGAMQLQFTDFSLPAGADLYLYNDYGEVFGPYADSGAFWSPNLRSDHVYLQVHYEGLDATYGLQKTRLSLGKVSHISPKFITQKKRPQPPTGNLCSYNEVCVEDAADSDIYPGILDAQDAVAAYTFATATGTYICSGGLIADDDPATDKPFFLTANHCVGDADLGSVTAYFDYRIDHGEDCDYWPGAGKTVTGSVGHTMSADADYALIELSGLPAEFQVKFMPWTDVVPSEGETLYRISHPAGAPQAYSEQRIESTFGTCGTLPMPNFLYSQDIFGATEGGSSGSPVYNGNGEIVGQLYGSCGYNNEPCDPVGNRTVDGSIAYWADDLSTVLGQASGCTANAQCDNGNACDGLETCDLDSGDCLPGQAVTCNDTSTECGDDICNPATGACEMVPNDSYCTDGDACTSDTCNVAGACESSAPRDCDDGSDCTDDSCDSLTGGCINVDNGTCPPDECAAYREACNSSADCCEPMSCHPRKGYCR
ncbi:MAG: trypsin-like peptidase domain-containing protein [Deltaproteobacteria bacterium]|nr:trypsin-like peptidase domain-containing protein [Deltaproteobacteria bacterium]MBW2253492.1 trypsin-like peptidase domain-containing protein [Deltaproteobacteria bacterium]